MCKGFISKIIPFSSVDGPGNRIAIFLQGCNFNCLYCHNPETINHCTHCGGCVVECRYDALKILNNRVLWDRDKCRECDRCIKACKINSTPKIRLMSVEEVMEEIKTVRPFISGVTLSGGEGTLQLDFVTSLFKKVKEMGLTTFIDTNGSIPIHKNSHLMKVTDGIMIDAKSFFQDEHIALTGKDNKIVLENIKELTRMGKLYEVRTVIVPKVLDNVRSVEAISNLIATIDPNIIYKLISYRDLGVRKEMIESHSPSEKTMENLKNIALKNGCKNVIII